jgi:IS605 OrfB family transposase
MQVLSVKCKLIVAQELSQEIDLTLERFADACNQILGVAKEANQWNTTKLHHLVYKPVRAATGLKANHVCQAIRRVIGNAKAVKQIHKFRPTSLNLDIRTFVYNEELQTVGVTLISGRKQFKLSIGGYQMALLRAQTPTSATLNKTRSGDYYINSKQLVQAAKQADAALAFEDLTNIRQSLNEKRQSKTERRRTNNWAFYQLRMFVGYKAEIAGVPILFIAPAYTSQTCSHCGHIHPEKGKSYRNGKRFKCGHCGFEHDAECDSFWRNPLMGGFQASVG